MYHDFVANWFSHSTEKFCRGTLNFSEKFFHRKILWIGGGYQDFLSKLLSHSTGIIRRGSLVFQKISGLKKLHEMVYHLFVDIWFSHSTEKFRRGTLHFSEKFYRKILWLEWGYQDFPSKLSRLTVPKLFVGGPFCFRKFPD